MPATGPDPETAGRGTGYRAAAGHPVAARLLTAQLVSEAGDFVGLAALLLLAFEATQSALGPALVLASRSLPALAVAGLLGRWLDRTPRRATLVATHLAGAVAIAICAVSPGTVTAVLSATLLGVTRSAFRSVQAAVIVESVPAGLRLALFGAAGVINQTAQFFGVLVGAAVTLTVGVRVSLLADVASFLVAAAILAGMPTAPSSPRPLRPAPLDGVRIIYRHPVLRWLTLLVLASAFSGSLPEGLAPAIATEAWLPAAMAASSAGGAAFTFWVARRAYLRRVANQMTVAGSMAAALVLTGIAVSLDAPDWLYVLGNVAVGAALGWLVGAQTTIAAVTPEGRMGQVEATIVAGLISSSGAGVLVLGFVASAVDPSVAYLIGGAVLLAALAVSAPRLRTADARVEPAHR